MDLSPYLREVEEKLSSHAPKIKRDSYFDPASYMGTGYKMLGLSVPLQRILFKEGYSFSDLPLSDQLVIWDYIYKEGQVFEVPTQAMLFVEKNLKKLDAKATWKVIMPWVKKVDNWGYSDVLSTAYSKLLLREYDLIFRQLQKWNNSKNPWERRQSLVTLAIHFRNHQRVPQAEAFSLIKNLLDDEDYFVQKGVGWVLREIRKRYPKETKAFLLKHIKEISGTAFTAATEKLDMEFKNRLKGMRGKIAKKGSTS